jgi:transcriptional regulator with XRE-family HTH domain
MEKTTNLGEMLRLYRAVNKVTIRALAPQIGTSPATLLRVEQGKGMDAATFMRLLNWLMREAR